MKWKSRKLWSAAVTLAIGTTVALIEPAAATPAFLGFLFSVYGSYVAGNVGEWKFSNIHFDDDDDSR